MKRKVPRMESFKQILVVTASLFTINCGGGGGGSPNNPPTHDAPELAPIDANQFAIFDSVPLKPFEIQLSAKSKAGYDINYSAAPSSLGIDPFQARLKAELNKTTGLFTWKFGEPEDKQIYALEFIATDDSEDMLYDSQTITIRVTSNGGKLYTLHCAICHADDGQGQPIPLDLQVEGETDYGGNVAPVDATAITVDDVITKINVLPIMKQIENRPDLDPTGTGLVDIVDYINKNLLGV